MAEPTSFDLLGTNIDSAETKVFNATTVYSLKSTGPDGEIVFSATSASIPGFIAGTASLAYTASYAVLAGNSISSSYALTASYVAGTITSASYAVSASYALSSSYASQAGNSSTININVFGSPVDSYLLMSNIAGTTGVAIGGDANLRYNSSTNVLTVPNISATSLTGSLLGTASNAISALTASFYGGSVISASYAATASLALRISASSINSNNSKLYGSSNVESIDWNARATYDASNIKSINWDDRTLFDTSGVAVVNWTSGILVGTGSLQGTSSWATNAVTASRVNTLNQNVIITGSVAIGTGSVGSGENNLLLGPAPAGGTGEGGQIALLAADGSYTSSSFLDNWQNQFRILRGPGATSNAGLMYMDLQSGNTQFVGAVTASAYSGLPNSWLHALRSGNQTIGSGTWASRDIIFNDVSSINFTYNSSTGVATLKAGKTYRITARLAWSAAGLYTLKFRIYNQTTSAYTGPTVELIQSPNGTYNVSDGTLEHMVAVGASDVDISIRTTADTNALTGEYIRGDLNTQLIIQQIA